MKKLLLAIFLIPAVTFAAETPAEEKTADVAQTDPAAPPAATTTTTTTTDKKEEPAATATKKPEEKKADQQPANASMMTPEQLAAAGAWTFGVNLDNSVGSGTFANAAYYASAVSSLSASASKPFKLFGRSFMGNGSIGGNFEFTRPDNVNGRRISWADARLGFSMPGAYKDKLTGFSVNPAISAVIPLTLESWYTGQLTSLGANVRFIRQIGPVSLRIGTGVGLPIFRNAYGVQHRSQDVVRYGGPLCRLSDPANSCGSSGMNPAFSANANVTALWFISDAIGAWGQIGASANWNQAASNGVDEFTPRGTQVNGAPVAYNGRGLTNGMSSTFGAWYQLTDIFSVSGGISTGGPMRTMQGGLRNPFFDMHSPELSLTSYTVSLSATL